VQNQYFKEMYPLSLSWGLSKNHEVWNASLVALLRALHLVSLADRCWEIFTAVLPDVIAFIPAWLLVVLGDKAVALGMQVVPEVHALWSSENWLAVTIVVFCTGPAVSLHTKLHHCVVAWICAFQLIVHAGWRSHSQCTLFVVSSAVIVAIWDVWGGCET